MTHDQICRKVANKINKDNQWTSRKSNGWITPKRVHEVLNGGGLPASHPMTQRIMAEARELEGK